MGLPGIGQQPYQKSSAVAQFVLPSGAGALDYTVTPTTDTFEKKGSTPLFSRKHH